MFEAEVEGVREGLELLRLALEHFVGAVVGRDGLEGEGAAPGSGPDQSVRVPSGASSRWPGCLSMETHDGRSGTGGETFDGGREDQIGEARLRGLPKTCPRGC